MNLEKIEELWAKDAESFFDHRDLPELLANDSMETPRLHAKYLQLHNEFKLMMSDAQTKYKKLYKEKWLYYNGKAPSQVYAEKPFDLKVLKGDLDMFIDSDDEVCRAKQKIDYLETCINSIDRILKEIHNRGFAIKNTIEIVKYYGIR
mgnify:FL=1|tara:strand:- start:290 stop:733 length:444 start_codon:yes stop_codon:yes gene_type:complete